MRNPGKGNRVDPEVNFPRNLALPGLQIKHSDISCHTTIEMSPPGPLDLPIRTRLLPSEIFLGVVLFVCGFNTTIL